MKHAAKHFLPFVCTYMQFMPHVAVAQEISSQPAILERVTVEGDEKITAVNLHFAPNTDASKISQALTDHGAFFQLNLSDVEALDSGRFLDGFGPHIKKVAIFQAKDANTSIRIFASDKTALLRPGLKVEPMMDRILVTLDHSLVSSALPVYGPANITEPATTSDSAPATISQDLSSPKNADTAAPNPSPGIQDTLRKSTSRAALFSLFMFGLFTVSYFLRGKTRFFRRKSQSPISQELPTFQTLASHHLAPKQKLIIMEISGRRMLLASTPSGVQLLTDLDASPGMNFQQHLTGPMTQMNQAMISDGRTKDAPYRSSQTSAQSLEMTAVKSLPEGAKRVLEAIKQKTQSVANQIPSSSSYDEKSATAEQETKNQVHSDKLSSARVKGAKSGSKQVYLRIDDEGITNMNQAKSTHTPEDITALIRRKLKDLPKIV